MHLLRSEVLRLFLAGFLLLNAGPARSAETRPADRTVQHGDARLDFDSPATLKRVDQWTSATLRHMQRSPNYDGLLADARKILTEPSRLGELSVRGDWIYNYHQTLENPHGIWRRSRLADYVQGQPRWVVLIDLAALSAREGRTYFFAGANCLGDHCLVSLSPNGRDAADLREYSLKTQSFVLGGFHVPASKSRTWWYDQDTLLIAPAVDAADRNEHGMAKRLKLWRRGTSLESAKLVFEIEPEDDSLSAMSIKAGGLEGFVAVRHLDFIRRDYQWVGLDGTRRAWPLPANARLLGGDKEALLLRLDEDWRVGGEKLASGSVVRVPLAPLLTDGTLGDVSLLYVPRSAESVQSAVVTGDGVILGTLHDYVSELVEVKREGDGWRARTLGSPAPVIEILSLSDRNLLLRAQGPLQPDSTLLWNLDGGPASVISRQEPSFDASGLTTTSGQAVSRDGTPIDYLAVHRRDMRANGANPTLIYGYGGFDVPVTQRYEPLFGKLWVERGGVYVHAYLRGGGERGPASHMDALREKHPLTFEDMEAVIRDLQNRKITAPRHTGIIGRSNGGLLVAAVMQRIPELLNAVVIGGPLIDMLDYHRLPPGGTWISEYGDPDIAADREFLSHYSPMQNIASGKSAYPVPLIITSRDDDRVLPGHARRYSELLARKGHDNFYFEDLQGGHYWELAGGPEAGDWRQRAVARAVEFTYLWERLGVAPSRTGDADTRSQ